MAVSDEKHSRSAADADRDAVGRAFEQPPRNRGHHAAAVDAQSRGSFPRDRSERIRRAAVGHAAKREEAVGDDRPRGPAVHSHEKSDAAHESTVMADADRYSK